MFCYVMLVSQATRLPEAAKTAGHIVSPPTGRTAMFTTLFITVQQVPGRRAYRSSVNLAPRSRAFQFAIRIDSIRLVMRIDSNRFV